MNCIFYISVDVDFDSFQNGIINHLGGNQLLNTYNQTSLQNNAQLLGLYFYGNSNHAVNYLLAREDGSTLRVFVEGVIKRDNLDQLISGIQGLFKRILKYCDQNNIKYTSIDSTIYAEDEEVLKGQFYSFKEKMKSNLPDIPTGIYLSALTVLYSLINPKTGDKFWESVINLLLVGSAVLLWLIVKAISKKNELIFKIK
jgi:hypothetical protein